MVLLTQFGNLFIFYQCSCNSTLMIAKATGTCRWWKTYVKIYFTSVYLLVGWLSLIMSLNFVGAITSKPIDQFQTLTKLLNTLPSFSSSVRVLRLPLYPCCNKNSTVSYANQVGFFGEDSFFLDGTIYLCSVRNWPLRMLIFFSTSVVLMSYFFCRKFNRYTILLRFL